MCVRDFPLPAPDMEGTTANEAAGGKNKAAPRRPEGRSAKVPTVATDWNAKPSRQQKQLKQVNKQSHYKGSQTCGRCLHFAAKRYDCVGGGYEWARQRDLLVLLNKPAPLKAPRMTKTKVDAH